MKTSKILLFLLAVVFLPGRSATSAPAAPGGKAGFPILVRGGDDRSFRPSIPRGNPVVDRESFDAIVVGGGLAGLTASVYLTDAGKKVLLLEKEEELGGLAFGGIDSRGIPFNRGGAYWAPPYEEEEKILQRIGLSGFADVSKIPEPIDSYLWNGELYLGLWEKETVEKLPASFAVFKHELEMTNSENLIPNQPMEDGDLTLDRLSAADWVRGMPQKIQTRTDPASREIYERFQSDKRLDPANPMKDVLDLLEQYGKSALGAGPEALSALVFANFYISEIGPRYSSPFGNGLGSRLMTNILKDRPHLAQLKTGATAFKIRDHGSRVEVRYLWKGGARIAHAAHVIFACQLWLAPQMIEGLEAKDPERVKAIRSIDYSHYAVHVVRVKGHPFRATYDTWFRPSDWHPTDFTDVIVGRWMDPAINGYLTTRDHKTHPPDDNGLLTVYHPYVHRPESMKKLHRNAKAHLKSVAEKAVQRMIDTFNPVLRKNWNSLLEVESVETSLWPYSIHVAKPGHFAHAAKLLRRPHGRIFFANNNIGAPAFEEALFRGHCAANHVLARTVKDFKQETWTHCVLE